MRCIAAWRRRWRRRPSRLDLQLFLRRAVEQKGHRRRLLLRATATVLSAARAAAAAAARAQLVEGDDLGEVEELWHVRREGEGRARRPHTFEQAGQPRERLRRDGAGLEGARGRLAAQRLRVWVWVRASGRGTFCK